MTGEALLAELTRRDVRSGDQVVESVHAGHLAVTGADGEVVANLGDPEQVVFVRSAAKPFQAAACVELLPEPPAADELAVAWASHRGEDRHLAAVRSLLTRSDTPADALTCPPAVAEAQPGAAPTRLQHNCSGKHALFAWAGQQVACPRERLLDPDGPLQAHVLRRLADRLGPPAAVGVDGCGAPAVAVPLAALARGFAALAVDEQLGSVRAAGLACPGLVGGDDRLESALLAAGVVAKVGAEGVYGVGWQRDGRRYGLAVKGADGSARGPAAAVIALLEAAAVVPPGTWSPPPPLGGGRPAGTVRVPATVRQLGAQLAT